jgi:NhaP-type Na+/H+ or K+/H+ antiporter
MSGAVLLLLVLAVGLASQWVAWRLRLPAIVVLIGAGILLGPVTGVIAIDLPRAQLADLIGLGVAIILFDGGMALKLGEWRRVGRGIGRLTAPAPLLAWLFGGLAAHYVGGLSWPVAWTLGAILVVTGPTVILPLVRQARLNKDSASLLKWEGIVNDPVGVLIAVLTFQFFTTPGGLAATLAGLALALLAAAVLGGVGGFATGFAFRRGWVPEHLKPPILMVLVLGVYWASNLVQHEAGLLSVTLMGLVLGNMRLAERESLRHFKENLTVVLLSVLFIVIPATLGPEHLQLLDLRAVAFVAAIMLVVRPLAIALATVRAPMRRGDRILLGWIAPRGIVAAATAGIFGPALVEAGYVDAERLLPIVFLIILATVVVHGLTIGPLTHRLGLASRAPNGLLIVGANPWTLHLARTLRELDIEVLVADGAYEHLRPFRDAGIPTYYGEVLSEDAEHELETLHLSHLLCATDNDFYNALVSRAWGAAFGHHRAFQLALHAEPSEASRRLTPQQRGHVAFDASATLESLLARLEQGWRVESARLGDGVDLRSLVARWGEPGHGWQLLGGRSPGGEFRLDEADRPLSIGTGWTVLAFAPNGGVQDAAPGRPRPDEAGTVPRTRP